jgi:hypothetical protein
MQYIVRLTDGERLTLGQIDVKFKGSSQKVRRVQVLLKANADEDPLEQMPRLRMHSVCQRSLVV